MSLSNNDFADFHWEHFLNYGFPALKSIFHELVGIETSLEEPFLQEDEPLPQPSTRHGRVISKLSQMVNVIKEVIDETQIDAAQNRQNYLQQPLHQGGNSGHQQQNATASQHQQMPYCSLCYDEDYPHPTHNCPHFPTPYEKRCEFIHMGSCPNCTRQHHQLEECPSHLSCIFHPGERHYTWLCPGHPASVPL